MSKKLYRKTTKNNQPKLDELAAFNSDCTFSDSAVLGYDASDESIKPLTTIDNFEVNNLTVHYNATLEGPVTACCCITTPAATITDLSATCGSITDLSATNITNSCTITTENVDVCNCVNVACDVNIGGNLYVCGTEYITDIEQVKSCCDKVLLRDGAVSGLAVGCLSGIEVNKYDGTNNTCVGVDNCGTLRVGDAGTCLEPVLTRDESSNMTDGLPLTWDATNVRAVTSDDAVVKYESLALPSEPVNKFYGITESKTVSNMKLKKFALTYFELSNGTYVPKSNVVSTSITIGSNTDLNIVTISSDFTSVNGSITTTKDSLLTGTVNLKKFYIGETANCKYYDVGYGDGSGSGVVIDPTVSNCQYNLVVTDGDDLFCASPTYNTSDGVLRSTAFSSNNATSKFIANFNCAKITDSCCCVCAGVENTTALLHSQVPGYPNEVSCIAADCKNIYLCANTSTNAYSCACFNGGNGYVNLHAHSGASDSELRLNSGETVLYSHNYVSSGNDSCDIYSSISLNRGVASVYADGFNVCSSVVCFTGLPTTTCSDTLDYTIVGTDCNGVTKKLEGLIYDPVTCKICGMSSDEISNSKLCQEGSTCICYCSCVKAYDFGDVTMYACCCDLGTDCTSKGCASLSWDHFSVYCVPICQRDRSVDSGASTCTVLGNGCNFFNSENGLGGRAFSDVLSWPLCICEGLTCRCNGCFCSELSRIECICQSCGCAIRCLSATQREYSGPNYYNNCSYICQYGPYIKSFAQCQVSEGCYCSCLMVTGTSIEGYVCDNPHNVSSCLVIGNNSICIDSWTINISNNQLTVEGLVNLHDELHVSNGAYLGDIGDVCIFDRCGCDVFCSYRGDLIIYGLDYRNGGYTSNTSCIQMLDDTIKLYRNSEVGLFGMEINRCFDTVSFKSSPASCAISFSNGNTISTTAACLKLDNVVCAPIICTQIICLA